MSTQPVERIRATYLSVTQYYALRVAVEPLHRLFGTILLVGSVLSRQDWRDVDLRAICDDSAFLVADEERRKFFNAAISEWLSARTGLPIDFQFQSYAEANAPENKKQRNAVRPLPR